MVYDAPQTSFTHAQTMDTRPLSLHPRGLGSLEPRLSILDFGLGALEKSQRESLEIFLMWYGGTMTSIYQSWSIEYSYYCGAINSSHLI